MERIHLTRKQVQKEMNELKEEGKIKREGANRGGRWIVVNND